MAALSTGLGFTLEPRAASAASSRRSRRSSASLSLSFGVWYALGALQVAPYYF